MTTVSIYWIYSHQIFLCYRRTYDSSVMMWLMFLSWAVLGQATSFSGLIRGTLFSYPLRIIVEESFLKFSYRNSGNLQVPYQWDGDGIIEYDQTNPFYEQFLSDWNFKNWPNHLITFEEASNSLRLRIGWNEYVLHHDRPPRNTNLRRVENSEVENLSNFDKCDCFPKKKFCAKHRKLAYLELKQGVSCQLLISFRRAYSLPWSARTVSLPFSFNARGVAIRLDINSEFTEFHQLISDDPVLEYSHSALVDPNKIELTMFGGYGRSSITFDTC
jgi:hypothetical protein